ncbi:ABC transporter G family member 22-like [Mangifera indica]|uniref:ABC transporter G family member 22-like n=1 Tax=Mangifera indica TaxID=29780 RepID=UPI001CF96A71|nr:ABC transporter G family member 22-like [Mangifera indica]
MQMELQRELRFEEPETFQGMTEAENVESKICVQRVESLGRTREPPCKTTIGKTKSLSAQFLVNIDDLVNNVSDNIQRQSPNCKDSVMAPSPADHEEDPDSCRSKRMQIGPSLPIYLKFQDVKYKVAVRNLKGSDKEKHILHGTTGSVNPGEVLAIMGPSGGGKTTLLNILSGRIKLDSGIIAYNDQPFSKSLKKRIGFVMQDDVVFPHLTVNETLTYTALLRLPNTLTPQQKKERAWDVICELGLERCQNTVIGGKFVRGVSGGERKRVCIGNEILLNPSLLFLDEPTSGLDSTTALRIVQMLRDIAKGGKTVATTIHQPSGRLFREFDKLILLGRGNSLYSGKASEAMPYFSSIGCSPLIAMNPAEFLIDLANGNINDKTFPSKSQAKLLHGTGNQSYQNGWPSPSDVHEYLVEAYEARGAKTEKRKVLKLVEVEGEMEMQEKLNYRESQATWWEQFSILLRRGLRERRHEYFSCMRVTQVISTAIIIGLLWCRSNASTPQRLQDQAGLLFFISVFWGFFPLFTAIFTFPQERAMLSKERSVDMYKLSAYFLARDISDLPLDLILPIVFLVIVYLMVGLKLNFTAFSLTMLTVFLSVIASQGLGLVMGAAFMDVKKATTLASIVVMTFMLSGGFFIQNVPYFMTWVRYISFNYHSYRLLRKIQFSCSDSGPCDSPLIRELRLDQGGLEVGALVAMMVGYRLLAYFLLRRMK